MGARAWSLFPTRHVHLFWRMFTSPVFVSWTSWKHTDCLMWNRKKFLAFYCESIWPDFEFWKHHVVDYCCVFSPQLKLCNGRFQSGCVFVVQSCVDRCQHLSLTLSLLSTTSSWPPEQRTSVSQSGFTPFKSHLKALQWQQMHNAHKALIHFLRESPTAL